jgi:hypothetical protein
MIASPRLRGEGQGEGRSHKRANGSMESQLHCARVDMAPYLWFTRLLAPARVLSAVLVFAMSVPLHAADRNQIAGLNVAATSAFTFLGCVVQAKLQKRPFTRGLAGRCAAAGAVAGGGFYQAKRLAARGDITTGWIVANLATSVVENTTAGEHPLSRIGYTFGPFRLRVVTPADARRESLVDVDVSLTETGFLLRAINDADDIDVRDGMIWFETDEPERSDGFTFHGYTWGIYPGAWSGARPETWRHEAIHAIQATQLDSIEPPALTLDRTHRFFRLRHLRLGAVHFVENVSTGNLVGYGDRWSEIEAYRLVDDLEPPR